MIVLRSDNVYTIDLDDVHDETYFLILNDDAWFEHKRLGHASMKLIS